MTHRTRDDESAVEQDADDHGGDEQDEQDVERRAPETAHLDDIEDGCGCAEVWEHLSEQRSADSRVADSD